MAPDTQSIAFNEIFPTSDMPLAFLLDSSADYSGRASGETLSAAIKRVDDDDEDDFDDDDEEDDFDEDDEEHDEDEDEDEDDEYGDDDEYDDDEDEDEDDEDEDEDEEDDDEDEDEINLI
jgi:hypothetical protein